MVLHHSKQLIVVSSVGDPKEDPLLAVERSLLQFQSIPHDSLPLVLLALAQIDASAQLDLRALYSRTGRASLKTACLFACMFACMYV